MNLFENTLLIGLLMLLSAFFSISEISLAAARKLKLEQLRDDGDARPARASTVARKSSSFVLTRSGVTVIDGIL